MTSFESSKEEIFVSYAHLNSEWVFDRLLPVLQAGGANVLIDRQHFEAGKPVFTQMDSVQDAAKRHILVLSANYLVSHACLQEMNHALKKDPGFQKGLVLPVRLDDIPLPDTIANADPLFVDFSGDKKNDPRQWQRLMSFANADLGTSAPHWLDVRDDLRRYMRRNQSANLVVKSQGIKWRSLLNCLCSSDDPKGPIPFLSEVNMDAGGTETRRGLIQAILQTLGRSDTIPPKMTDLGVLHSRICEGPRCHLMLKHFDRVMHRKYDRDLFSAFRALSTEENRNLVFLFQSYMPLKNLLPEGVWESSPVDVKNVEICKKQ